MSADVVADQIKFEKILVETNKKFSRTLDLRSG